MSDSAIPIRDRAIESLRQLPESASLDDVIDRLYVIARIERGLAEVEAGEGVPADEARWQVLERLAG